MLMTMLAATAWSTALAETEGCWRGELQYRDYQSDQMQAIPVRECRDATPDGSLLASDLEFTDPGFQVYAKVIVTEGEDGAYNEAYASRGRIEASQYKVTRFERSGPQAWRMTIERFGEDSDAPAQIRITMSREAGRLVTEKQVRPLGEDAFLFRNRTVLTQETDK